MLNWFQVEMASNLLFANSSRNELPIVELESSRIFGKIAKLLNKKITDGRKMAEKKFQVRFCLRLLIFFVEFFF